MYANSCRVCLKPENNQNLLNLFDRKSGIIEQILFITGINVRLKFNLICLFLGRL